jgi:imidazolonepropionase
MRMSPDEAVLAATLGGARALRRTDVGHLGTGARADVVLLDAPSHVHLAYRPGVPLVVQVWRGGEPVAGDPRGTAAATTGRATKEEPR